MEGSEAASQAAKLDPLQQRAVDIALSGKNLFLTGGPGTGKSFTLRHIIEQLRTKHYAERLAAHAGATGDPPRRTDSVLVTAPTGVAAILVGGQTLFAKPGPGKPLPTTKMFGNMWGNKDKWREVRTVVVDEISMVDGEFFEWWHAMLQKINSGMQLIVCGLVPRCSNRRGTNTLSVLTLPRPSTVSDYFQLPPIGGEAASRSILQPTPDEGARRSDDTPYGSFLEQCMVDAHLNNKEPFLPFNFRETKGKLALQSLAWQEAGLVTCKLERCFRTNSEVLLAGCSAMREGKDTGPEIDALVRATSRRLPPRHGVEPTTLFSTKAEVKRMNNEELEKLDRESEHVYAAEDQAVPDESFKGEQPRAWAMNELMRDPMFTKEDECPAVEVLKLRLDTQVMLLQNEILSEEDKDRTPVSKRLVNGSRGVVIGWAPAPDAKDSDEQHGSKPSSAVRGTGGEGGVGGEGSGEAAKAAVEPPASETLYPLVQFVNGRTKVIIPANFEKEIYLLGTCVRTQVPIALAWCAPLTTRRLPPAARRLPPAACYPPLNG